MKSSIDHEKIFFNYFLTKPHYLKGTGKGFFANRDLDQIAKLSKDFYLKFGESPSKQQMSALIKDDPNEISEDIVKSIYDININEYDQDWLKRTGEAWVKWKHFDKQLVRTIEYVKTQDVSPENVEDVVNRAIGMIYAGEQNIGKSIWLANDAANFVRMGHNVVFITAEMSAQKVLKRIGANLLNVPMMDYDKNASNRDYMKRRLEKVSRGLLPPGKLFVKEYPTSQGTIPDIEAYLKDLEESQDHKVNVLVVDYINILANYRNPNTENTYMKIKQIAEDLRALAVKRDMLVISATQINRGAWDATEVRMENIAESAGLAHTADVMYALIQDSVMHAEREYWLKVLKIRDGQGKGSRCKFNIDYEHMRLTETDEISG